MGPDFTILQGAEFLKRPMGGTVSKTHRAVTPIEGTLSRTRWANPKCALLCFLRTSWWCRCCLFVIAHANLLLDQVCHRAGTSIGESRSQAAPALGAVASRVDAAAAHSRAACGLHVRLSSARTRPGDDTRAPSTLAFVEPLGVAKQSPVVQQNFPYQLRGRISEKLSLYYAGLIKTVKPSKMPVNYSQSE